MFSLLCYGEASEQLPYRKEKTGEKGFALLAFATALFLGFLHAFGPDHLAAVSTFVSRRRRLLPALLISVRWGLAHLLAVLLLGVGISALSIPLPHWLEPYAESVVGVVLVCVGVVALVRNFRSRKLHLHPHHHGSLVHSHLHSHAHSEEHWSGHAITLTGLVHGLAGAIPAITLFPLGLLGTPWLLGAYLLVFGIGVILGMALYCVALSGLLRTLSESHLQRWAQPILASVSCALGLFWIARQGPWGL